MLRSAFILIASLLLGACGSAASPTPHLNQELIRPFIQVTPGVPLPTPWMPSSISPGSNPYAPRTGDDFLQRGTVFIDFTALIKLKGNPVQIDLNLKGSLPDPCHQIRIGTTPPDANLNIAIEVYSVTDGAQVCAQVLKPFDVDINLGTFPPGHYTVTVNGKQIGSFDF